MVVLFDWCNTHEFMRRVVCLGSINLLIGISEQPSLSLSMRLSSSFSHLLRLCGIADAVVLNSIEFWTGDIPLLTRLVRPVTSRVMMA